MTDELRANDNAISLQAAYKSGRASRDAEVEALKRDAERYRHIRSTAFREFDAYGMWLRFSAIRHYDGPSDRLNEKFVDRLVDEAREAAMAKESGE